MTRRKEADPQDPFAALKAGSSTLGYGAHSKWSEVDMSQLQDMIAAVTAKGDALVLGLTSDGGAASITILSSGLKRRFYDADAEALARTMTAIIDWARNA